MLCKKLEIEITDEEVSSLCPYIDPRGRDSVVFSTDDGHRVCLDKETLERGLACIRKHREGYNT